MNAAQMVQDPIRMLLMGYPKTGKTGALASLANAGFKLRILDFDGNPESLLRFTLPEFRKNIDILTFEDPLADKGSYMAPVGTPTAFANSVKALQRWKYKDGDNEVDLGSHRDWGPDTILVLDGLTGQASAAMRRATATLGKTPFNVSGPTWGLAQKDQEAVVENITARLLRHHTIVISHVKIIGPRDIEKGDSDIAKAVKEATADLVPTRLFPSALGKDLAQRIAQHFPVAVVCETEVRNKKVIRAIRYEPTGELDLGMPLPNAATVLGDLTVEDGLLRIFEAMGAHPPARDGEQPK
jgi:hypothetical protein